MIKKNKAWVGECKYLEPPAGVTTCEEYTRRLKNNGTDGFKEESCEHDDLIFDDSVVDTR